MVIIDWAAEGATRLAPETVHCSRATAINAPSNAALYSCVAAEISKPADVTTSEGKNSTICNFVKYPKISVAFEMKVLP